jgi:hypothetical protein
MSQDDSKPEKYELDDNSSDYRHIDHVQTPISHGSPMTAKRFMEIKALVRDNNPHGLRPLFEYVKDDIQATVRAFEADRVKSDQVPLTMYVNGERRVIGTAIIDGNMVIGHVDKIDGTELNDVIAKNPLNGVSFGFHISSLKVDYPGAKDIWLTPERPSDE